MAMVVETLESLPLKRQSVETIAKVGGKIRCLVLQRLDMFGRLAQPGVKIFHSLVGPLLHTEGFASSPYANSAHGRWGAAVPLCAALMPQRCALAR